MSLINEAGYLYVYSKKVKKINKEIVRLTKKSEKHKKKHDETLDEHKRVKHRTKHHEKITELKTLINRHNKLIKKLTHHQAAYAHALRKEHTI